MNYANLDYKNIKPLIKKYFSPSAKINETINNIKKKYNIVFSNTVSLYYRGTDKKIETQLASFIDYINDKKLKNVVIIDENKTSYSDRGIHNEEPRKTNYQDMFYFLSTIIIISKCKYIICSSCNCSIWTLFYRGNSENVIQYLNGTWYK